MSQRTTHHDRRLERRLRESPELRAEFERQQKKIAAADGPAVRTRWFVADDARVA